MKSDMIRALGRNNSGRVIFMRFAWATLVLAAVIMLAGSTGVDADRGQFAILVRARGEVQYQPAGTTKWVGASERMRLNQGDILKTGVNGQAVIKLSERNFVDIGPSSQMTLSQSQVRSVPDPNNRVFGIVPARQRVLDAEIDLTRGRAVSVLKGLQGSSNYRLRTPIATAGVRGTIFLAEVIPPGENRGAKQVGGGLVCNFACYQGSVNMTPTLPGVFTPFLLNTGQFASFSLTGPGGVQDIPPGTLQTIVTSIDVIDDVQGPSTEDRSQGPEFPSNRTSSDNYMY